jgi:hypothetical protein
MTLLRYQRVHSNFPMLSLSKHAGCTCLCACFDKLSMGEIESSMGNIEIGGGLPC